MHCGRASDTKGSADGEQETCASFKDEIVIDKVADKKVLNEGLHEDHLYQGRPSSNYEIGGEASASKKKGDTEYIIKPVIMHHRCCLL